MSNRRNYQNINHGGYSEESVPYGPTMPPSIVIDRNANRGAVPAQGETEPIDISGDKDATEPVESGFMMPKTEVVNELDVDGKKIAPVVGWLVGIKGCCRGQDYRLHSGHNMIGRGTSLDVLLNDVRISRGVALRVTYDPSNKRFRIKANDDNGNLMYLNCKDLDAACTLNAYDRIQIGYDEREKDYVAELMFVPLCGEHFNWEA